MRDGQRHRGRHRERGKNIGDSRFYNTQSQENNKQGQYNINKEQKRGQHNDLQKQDPRQNYGYMYISFDTCAIN